jgi:hypothetical protein
MNGMAKSSYLNKFSFIAVHEIHLTLSVLQGGQDILL